MCANTCARPASTRSASAWARRPAPPGCPRTTPGSAGPRPRSSTGTAPALPNLGGSLLIFADLLGHDLGAPLVPGLRAARAQRQLGASPARAWPSWPACSGTWATRDRPCATPPRFDPDAETTPCPSRPAPPQPPWPWPPPLAAAHAAYNSRSRSSCPSRRAADRFGGAPAGQQAGKLGQPVIIENRPGVHRDRRRGRGPAPTRATR